MTIVNENARRRELVIAGSAVLPYDFPILSEDDIEVIQDGVTLVPPQYFVTGVGDDAGGTVILTTAPSDGTRVVLLGRQPRKQTSVYTLEGFPPARIQNDFNKIWMAIQQAYEILNRTPALAKHSLLDAPPIPDPSAADLFLRVTSLTPFTLGWGTLATLAGAVGIPLSQANGGTGASYASASALAAGLGLARWASLDVTPAAAVLTLPNPLTGNRVNVGAGNFAAISVSGVATGTLLLLDFVTGSNVLTDGTSFQLQGRSNYTTVAGDRSLFFYNGTAWFEVERFSALSGASATKFRRGDGTWQTLPSQTLRAGVGAGLLISNNAVDPTNDIDVSVGDATSDDADPQARVSMFLAAGLTKQLDATWAAGNNAGMRISGQALADGVWHIFLFKRSGGAIDVCASNNLSFVTPDAGTNRIRIFSIVRTAGAIRAFIYAGGKRVLMKSPSVHFDATVGTGAPGIIATLTGSVPSGIVVDALLNIFDLGTAGHVYIHSPDVDDIAPSTTLAPLASFGTNSGQNSWIANVRTNTSGQVVLRSTASKNAKLAVLGYDDVTLLR